nr:hypothetical protein [uncultured Pseudodesulfovibrio sp.]
MADYTNMNDTTMLGTYSLDGNVPVEPEIVLANCTDTAMLGHLVSVFQGNPDIRFFLIHDAPDNAVDLSGDLHFLKDGGSWVLANNNSLLPVLFDNAEFNPNGAEDTFSLTQGDDGTWAIVTDDLAALTDIPPSEQLLVDLAGDDLFVDDAIVSTSHDHDSFFIDPSVLENGESEIIVTNFTVGSDTLELPEGMSVKDVIVDTEHDLTEVIIGLNDTVHDDIVVKLLGVSQPNLPMHDFSIDTDTSTDDLINHLIHSGRNVD